MIEFILTSIISLFGIVALLFTLPKLHKFLSYFIALFYPAVFYIYPLFDTPENHRDPLTVIPFVIYFIIAPPILLLFFALFNHISKIKINIKNRDVFRLILVFIFFVTNLEIIRAYLSLNQLLPALLISLLGSKVFISIFSKLNILSSCLISVAIPALILFLLELSLVPFISISASFSNILLYYFSIAIPIAFVSHDVVCNMRQKIYSKFGKIKSNVLFIVLFISGNFWLLLKY